MRTRQLVLVGFGFLMACGDPPPQPSRTLTTHPRAADRYARLLQRQLVESDVVALGQAMTCEISRLAGVLGSEEAKARVYAVVDSVHRGVDREKLKRIDQALGGRSYGGEECDSLNAISDREEPIAPVDPAIRDR